MRKAYQTDLSDAEWSCLEPHLPVPDATGRPKLHSTREILNAVFYVVRGGCAWRLLPHDFPPWKTVYHYFRSWRLDGTWDRMHATLRKRVRVRAKRNPQPSAGPGTYPRAGLESPLHARASIAQTRLLYVDASKIPQLSDAPRHPGLRSC